MAKLSAHGREVARLTTAVDLSGDDHIEREEVHYSFRSDGYVMLKRIVVFRRSQAEQQVALPVQRHSWGWARGQRLGRRTYASIARYAATMQDRAVANGVEVDFKLHPRGLSA